MVFDGRTGPGSKRACSRPISRSPRWKTGRPLVELTELASVVRTFLAFAPDPAADPRELLALAQRMLSVYPEGDPGQFTGLLTTGYACMALHDAQAAGEAFEAARQIALAERLYFGIVESTFHLARLSHSQGLLRRAAELCRQGQADIAAMLPGPEQALPALGSLDIALGCVLLEQDRLDEAGEHLRHGLELMGGGMNPHYLMTAYIALFRLHEIQGRSEEALEIPRSPGSSLAGYCLLHGRAPGHASLADCAG